MIKKLPQEVINKIAAGEIVQRPYSVIKEMVENSIDAQSTNILIHINNAGLDQIRIIDNGVGIMKEDFDLLCERYATSKIDKSEDLNQLRTFGFRGEALASISFVSMMQVTSKRRECDLGYRGEYRDQKLSNLTPVGCGDGTEIVVDQLFYNLEGRREGLNKNEEKKSIQKLIQYLSIHHENINFKLYFEKNNDYSTQSQQRIQTICNVLKINDLLDEAIESEIYKFQAQYVCTRLSSLKYRRELCLFINHRLVESEQLKKAVYSAYSTHYQCIHDDIGGFFVYLSIEMDPKLVDPNVHPNKKEIKFINESEISEAIESALQQTLSGQNVQKQLVQSQLIKKSVNKDDFRKSLEQGLQKTRNRVDPNIRTLDQMFNNYNNNNNNKIKKNLVKSQVNQEILQYMISKSNPNTNLIIKQMVYIGLIDYQQILIQIDNTLNYINVVPLLFNMFWHQLATGTIRSNEIKPIQYQYNKDFENHFNFVYNDTQLTSCPCSIDILQQLISLNLLQASKLIAEHLSLQKYDDKFIRDTLFPYLKTNTMPIVVNIEYQQLLCTDDLYSIFERC